MKITYQPSRLVRKRRHGFRSKMKSKGGKKTASKKKKKRKKKTHSLMKSKITSLSKNAEFKSLLNGKRISSKYSTIFFKKLSDKNSNRLNISFVTKKKIGNSVKRNKIKRRLRNIMNEAVKKIKLNFDYSFLVIAKSSMLNNEYKIIKETLFQDFAKIK